MKTNQIHGLNVICMMLLIEEFSLAVEKFLNRMVELEKSYKMVEEVKIDFENKIVDKNENLFSYHKSGFKRHEKIQKNVFGD
ncbi:MAG: hypothetical protein E7Z82_08320 [Methanobrevibacter sp.]|nr:hypothetical protein [Methanobrevibacter sp.]